MDAKRSPTQVPIFIKPEDLHLYESIKFIDVRDVDSYEKGHIKNAVNAYGLFTYLLPTSAEEDMEAMRTFFRKELGKLGISGNEHVVIYEQGMNKQYGASCRGFYILKFMKHPRVSTLEGGLDSFARNEVCAQQLTSESSTIVPCEYNGDSEVELSYQMVGRDEVLNIIKNKPSGTHLLDVRDAVEWNGLSSSPYGVDFTPRKGRLTDSIWIEWYAFHELDDLRKMTKRKTNEQIEVMMKEKNIEKNDEIIIYCFKGSRASVALMCLKEAGYTNVRNYFASWNEWSRDFSLPIDDTIYNDK